MKQNNEVDWTLLLKIATEKNIIFKIYSCFLYLNLCLYISFLGGSYTYVKSKLDNDRGRFYHDKCQSILLWGYIFKCCFSARVYPTHTIFYESSPKPRFLSVTFSPEEQNINRIFHLTFSSTYLNQSSATRPKYECRKSKNLRNSKPGKRT